MWPNLTKYENLLLKQITEIYKLGKKWSDIFALQMFSNHVVNILPVMFVVITNLMK